MMNMINMMYQVHVCQQATENTEHLLNKATPRPSQIPRRLLDIHDIYICFIY